MIEAKKREEMKQTLGLTDEQLDGIESHNASLATEAVDNREFKEKSEETSETDATEQAAEGDVEAKAEEATEEDATELNEETVEVEEETVEEAAEAEEVVAEEGGDAELVDDGDMFTQFADLLKSMDARMDQLQKSIEDINDREKERAEKKAELSPIASTAGFKSLFAKYNGTSEVSGTEIDEEEDEELLKSKPKEAETRGEFTSKFNSPLLSKFIEAGS